MQKSQLFLALVKDRKSMELLGRKKSFRCKVSSLLFQRGVIYIKPQKRFIITAPSSLLGNIIEQYKRHQHKTHYVHC